MTGPASIPDAASATPPVHTPAAVSDESVFASLIEDEGDTTASLAAIALPLHIVRARRRTRYRLRLPQVPWGVLGQVASRLLLWLPPLLVLAAALWAVATGVGSLLQVLRLVVTLQFELAVAQFPHIDAAGRVVLASLGYFALLATLRPLTRGLFGRGWARLRLLIAVPLVLPSAWLFVAGAELATSAPPLTSVAPELWRLLLILLVLDAIALAVVSSRELRTPAATLAVSRRSKPLAELEDLDLSEIETERLPIVRFGPPSTEQVSLQPGIEPEMADTQGMRVPGLLHLLSEPRQEDAPERTRTDSTE
jgi:hypothetical protein